MLLKELAILLSPNDWALGGQIQHRLCSELCNKVTGKKGRGGQESWVPNIKLPNDLIHYDVQEDDSSTRSMDDLTPEQRKKNMRAIRSKDTTIELALRGAAYFDTWQWFNLSNT